MSNFQFNGVCIGSTQKKQGTSQNGNAWVTQTFIFNVIDGEYSKTIAVSVFGVDKLRQFDIHKGERYLVSFDIKSQQSKQNPDSFFTTLNAYRVQRCDARGIPLKSNEKTYGGQIIDSGPGFTAQPAQQAPQQQTRPQQPPMPNQSPMPYQPPMNDFDDPFDAPY